MCYSVLFSSLPPPTSSLTDRSLPLPSISFPNLCFLFGGCSFIPEGTGVIVPPYCLHRDSRYFSPYPDSFIPERWLNSSANSSNAGGNTSTHAKSNSYNSNGSIGGSSECDQKFKTDREAFIPFSYGPANCAGKPLALLEVRYVIALLVTRFEFFLPVQASEEEMGIPVDSKKLACQWEDALEDRFVFMKGPLRVSVRSNTNSDKGRRTGEED